MALLCKGLQLMTAFGFRRAICSSASHCILTNAERGIKYWNEKQNDPPLDISALSQSLLDNLERTKLGKASTLLKIFDAVKTKDDLEIAENALIAFRKGINLPRASMPMAVVRACLRLDLPERAVDIVSQKRKYGIFPSVKVYNVLMDYYLSRDNSKAILRTYRQLLLDELTPNPISLSLAVLGHMLQNTEEGYEEAVKLSKYCLEKFPDHKHHKRPIHLVIKFSMENRERERVKDLLEILSDYKPNRKVDINCRIRGYASIQDYDNILSLLEYLCNDTTSLLVSEGVIKMMDQLLANDDSRLNKWNLLKADLQKLNKIEPEKSDKTFEVVIL